MMHLFASHLSIPSTVKFFWHKISFPSHAYARSGTEKAQCYSPYGYAAYSPINGIPCAVAA